ncbi:MAG: glycosyl transferase [Clostridia bacterium]|nr:glycosyl transferase [Clostridia bacterium]
MGKVVFFSIPAYGHINPTLGIIKELVNLGEHVIYYAFDSFKNKIEETGAEYRRYNLDSSALDANQITSNFAFLYRTLLEITEKLLPGILEDLKKEAPDYIIHDSLSPFGKYAARLLGIPAINSVTTFAFKKSLWELPANILISSLMLPLFYRKDILKGLKIQKQLESTYHIKTEGMVDIFMNAESLNLVYTSKEFQPGGSSFGAQYVFVGPSVTGRSEDAFPELDRISKENPIVYISLGTVNKNIDFFPMCFHAFQKMKITFLVSLGRQFSTDEFKGIPENFIVKDYVPQLKILRIADAFITHGGLNSVHEGLTNGVPLIVYPQQEEQRTVALRVREMGAGIYLKNPKQKNLIGSLEKILNEKKFKDNCLALKTSFENSGGVKKAIHEIMRFKEAFSIH